MIRHISTDYPRFPYPFIKKTKKQKNKKKHFLFLRIIEKFDFYLFLLSNYTKPRMTDTEQTNQILKAWASAEAEAEASAKAERKLQEAWVEAEEQKARDLRWRYRRRRAPPPSSLRRGTNVPEARPNKEHFSDPSQAEPVTIERRLRELLVTLSHRQEQVKRVQALALRNRYSPSLRRNSVYKITQLNIYNCMKEISTSISRVKFLESEHRRKANLTDRPVTRE